MNAGEYSILWKDRNTVTVAGPGIPGKVYPSILVPNTDHGVIVMASQQVRGMDIDG